MSDPINRTPAHLRCTIGACPGVYELNDRELLIVGKRIDENTPLGDIGDDEDAVIIDLALLGGLIQATAATDKPSGDHRTLENARMLADRLCHSLRDSRETPYPPREKIHTELKQICDWLNEVVPRNILREGDRTAPALDGRSLEPDKPSGDHPGSEFEAKAKKVAQLIFDTGGLMRSSAIASIATALAEAVAADRRETLNLLGCDADGKFSSREVVRNGIAISVSDDAYYNLEGAIIDLERADADKVCIRTIKRVQAQIAAVVKRSRGDVK